MNSSEGNRILLIMNPKSGTMQAAKYLVDIIQHYSDAGYRTTVMMTGKSGDAREFAIKYGEEADIILVSGGDGTFNEVLDGVISSGLDVRIAYIPSGSTNDFAAGVGLPRGIMEAADVAITGEAKSLDIGSFNGRYFSYVASFGALTSTSYKVPQNLKNILGHTAYVLQGARDILAIKPIHARIITDEGTPNERIYDDDFLFGAVCNSTSVAGILRLDAFDVDMNDGMMEVLLIRTPSNILELNDTVRALITNTFDSSTVELFSAKDVRVEIDESVHWTLDGEYEKGGSTIEINTIQSAISLITPPAEMEYELRIHNQL